MDFENEQTAHVHGFFLLLYSVTQEIPLMQKKAVEPCSTAFFAVLFGEGWSHIGGIHPVLSMKKVRRVTRNGEFFISDLL